MRYSTFSLLVTPTTKQQKQRKQQLNNQNNNNETAWFGAWNQEIRSGGARG